MIDMFSHTVRDDSQPSHHFTETVEKSEIEEGLEG